MSHAQFLERFRFRLKRTDKPRGQRSDQRVDPFESGLGFVFLQENDLLDGLRQVLDELQEPDAGQHRRIHSPQDRLGFPVCLRQNLSEERILEAIIVIPHQSLAGQDNQGCHESCPEQFLELPGRDDLACLTFSEHARDRPEIPDNRV